MPGIFIGLPVGFCTFLALKRFCDGLTAKGRAPIGWGLLFFFIPLLALVPCALWLPGWLVPCAISCVAELLISAIFTFCMKRRKGS